MLLRHPHWPYIDKDTSSVLLCQHETIAFALNHLPSIAENYLQLDKIKFSWDQTYPLGYYWLATIVFYYIPPPTIKPYHPSTPSIPSNYNDNDTSNEFESFFFKLQFLDSSDELLPVTHGLGEDSQFQRLQDAQKMGLLLPLHEGLL